MTTTIRDNQVFCRPENQTQSVVVVLCDKPNEGWFRTGLFRAFQVNESLMGVMIFMMIVFSNRIAIDFGGIRSK